MKSSGLFVLFLLTRILVLIKKNPDIVTQFMEGNKWDLKHGREKKFSPLHKYLETFLLSIIYKNTGGGAQRSWLMKPVGVLVSLFLSDVTVMSQ